MSFRCPKSWGGMKGNDQRRFCGECQLHVVNLSAMSRRAGESLLAHRGERTCITYLSRADGSMVTASRWRCLARSARVVRGGLTALLALLTPVFVAGCADTRRLTSRIAPAHEVKSTPPPDCERSAGMVAVPPPR